MRFRNRRTNIDLFVSVMKNTDEYIAQAKEQVEDISKKNS